MDQHTMNSASFGSSGNRRSACDRCRKHKLRCDRGPDSLPCLRCAKVNAQCVMGPALKSGRPVQLYSVEQLHTSPGREDCQGNHANPSHQQALPGFPTPPSARLDDAFGTIPTQFDSYLATQFLPTTGDIHDFNGAWMDGLGQDDSDSNFARSATITVSNQNAGAPMTPPPDTHAYCLKKLGELHQEVLADLDAVKASKTADKCAQASTASTSEQTNNHLVGRVLDHSTTLLEILNCFQPAFEGRSLSSSGDAVRTTQVHSKSLRCDVPTMFSLLSCYVCLIRIYRTMFSSIHDSMPLLMSSGQPVPQLFPGLNLAGFKLESRPDFQVQILVQLSEDVLGKIDAKFGVTEDTTGANWAIFERGRAAKILHMMLEEEDNEQPPLHETRGSCGSLRSILASLKRIIQTQGANNDGSVAKFAERAAS